MVRKLVTFGIIGIATLPMLVFFQNCSVMFTGTSDPSYIYQGKEGPSVEIEDGRSATNKHLLSAKIKGLVSENMAEMRIASARDVQDDKFPDSAVWQEYSETLQYELGSEFASDGSLDTVKELVVQVRPKDVVDSSEFPIVRGRILLDTVPPTAELQGLLLNGLQNTDNFSKGQVAPLDFKAKDVPAPTGNMSGLDNSGALQIGWTESEDCSKIDPEHLGPQQPDSSQARQFSWPKGSTLEAFFICIFIRDAAGNTSTALSQPMTRIWQVIAGDNNQGNGGSWQAPNVRFAYPSYLAADTKDNLYIYDSDFLTIRKVNAQGDISTYLGNGRTGTPDASNRFTSPLPSGTSFLASDSSDRFYFGAGAIYRATVNGEEKAFKLETLVRGSVETATVKTFKDGKEYLVFATQTRNGATFTVSDVYIYKVPLAEFEGKTLPLALTSLQSFRIAGSGAVNNYKSGQLAPKEQDAATAVLPIVSGLYVDDNDDLYIGGISDGADWGFGEQVVLLMRDSKIYKIVAGTSWLRQLAIANFPDGSRVLYISGNRGISAVELKVDQLPLASYLQKKSLPENAVRPEDQTHVSYGVLVSRQKADAYPVVFATDASASKILKYKGLERTESFGRDVFATGKVPALSSMVNTPSGITEDKDGNIYFVEALSHVIRKLDKSGELTNFIGAPMEKGVPSAQGNKPVSAVRLDGSTYDSGYRLPLIFDEKRERLVLGQGSSGGVLFLPLDTDKNAELLNPPAEHASTIGSDPGIAAAAKDKSHWPVFYLAMSPLNDEILVSRYLSYKPYRTQIMGYSMTGAAGLRLGNELNASSGFFPGALSKTKFIGPVSSVALTNVQPMTSLEGHILYTAGNNVIASDGLQSVSLGAGGVNQYKDIDAVSESDGRTIVFGLYGFDLMINIVSGTGKPVSHTLCLPGSFLNAGYVKVSRDKQSLLISDTKQRRVLRYWFRDESGATKFFRQNATGGCEAI